MGFAAFLQALAALVPAPAGPPALPALTPRQKAALVVVSGLPAPRGVAGVLVQEFSRREARPRNGLVFVDQEGGSSSTFDRLLPGASAASLTSRRRAFRAGRATGVALRIAGVDVDLAPVVDLRGGPLGSRHFARPGLAISFAGGLQAGGVGACAKHFPGLSPTPSRSSGAATPCSQAARRAAREPICCSSRAVPTPSR